MGQIDIALQNLLQQASLPPLPKDAKNMYAVAFDLDTQALQASYGKPSLQNAYAEIKAALVAKGFTWQQGSVYFGDASMTAVKCVLAVQSVSAALPWFKASVKDIRMLRIEEMNDLTPAL
ncbi:virulence factor [Duganella hordei]|uniref:virulence factor n=1 Tax=Duganella hordei TaxID=2865934 RepID=UPI0030E846E3